MGDLNGDIDLNIQNYTVQDIEYFFGLEAIPNYTTSMVEQREYEIRTQLFNGGNFNSKFKRSFVEFISSAKERLVNTRNAPSPSTLQKNTRLDVVDFPKVNTNPLTRSPELITHPETPYLYSNPSEFFQGTLNPLNTRILTKSLTIDTKFRENMVSSTSSDFLIQLPLKLVQIVSMQVTSIEFPISFYGISESYGNNFLYISAEQTLPNSQNIEITTQVFVIPDGNYYAAELIDTLNALMGSNCTPDLENPFSFVHFSLDKESARVTVCTRTDLNPAIRSIMMDFTRTKGGVEDLTYPLTARLGWNLGFTSCNYLGSTTYVSDALVDPSPMRYVYLSVDDFNNSVNNGFVAAFSKSILNPNILARITINGEYFSVITDTTRNLVTEPRQYFGPVDIQRLHVRLFDDHGRILDMNNMNYSFCLTFKMLYNL